MCFKQMSAATNGTNSHSCIIEWKLEMRLSIMNEVTLITAETDVENTIVAGTHARKRAITGPYWDINDISIYSTVRHMRFLRLTLFFCTWVCLV